MGFVDKLFECLTTKNYLGISSEKDVPKEEVKPVVVKSDAVEVKNKPECHFILQKSCVQQIWCSTLH